MKVKIYQDAKGEWRWSLISRNGRVVADSGEGYKTRAGVRKAAERMMNGGGEVYDAFAVALMAE